MSEVNAAIAQLEFHAEDGLDVQVIIVINDPVGEADDVAGRLVDALQGTFEELEFEVQNAGDTFESFEGGH